MNYIIVYNFEADYFQLKFSIKGTLACLYCIAGKHEGAKFGYQDQFNSSLISRHCVHTQK